MLIRHATVLTMDPRSGAATDTDVLIDADRIAAIGRGLDAPPGHDVVDATGCLLIPGFVDTHRHMWEAGMRGHGVRDTLGGYFQRVLLGIAPELTPEDLGVAETLSARASLAAGITTVQDTSDVNGPPGRVDAIVAALRESGLRARFGYGMARAFTERHGAGFPDEVARVRTELLPDDDALVTMGLTVIVSDDDAERHNAAVAADLGLRTAHHVRADVLPSRLLALGALRPGTTFIHGNGLPRDELALIADSGGSLSMSPVVEMALGLGNPMIAEALTVPGLPLNLSIDVEIAGPTDMFTQMRTLYLVARAASTATPLTPRDVLAMATLGGARALGLDEKIGTIAVGKQADLVLLRTDDAGAGPVVDPYATVVTQLDRSHVDTVLVAGVVHRRGGRPVVDDAELLDRASATLDRLRTGGLLAIPAADVFDADPVEEAMVAANATRGPRTVPARAIPVPTTVSSEMRAAIAAPYRSPAWNLRPADRDAWRAEAARLAQPTLELLPELRRRFGVTVRPADFGGIPGFLVVPDGGHDQPVRLLHLHGGGFVYHPGEAGTAEAVLMAGIAGVPVASVSHRHAYDAPFPAALDDVTTAWEWLCGDRDPQSLGVFGTSAGGALALSLSLRARAEGRALPGALGIGSPWSDLTETGDSYRTLEWLDNVEVSYRGFLSGAAALYAGTADPRDPLLSPVYGDYRGAPPSILISGTRDLFLSNTVRVHRAMRTAGVDARLHVFEGQSHAQYLTVGDSPETREVYREMAGFLAANLSGPPLHLR